MGACRGGQREGGDAPQHNTCHTGSRKSEIYYGSYIDNTKARQHLRGREEEEMSKAH